MAGTYKNYSVGILEAPSDGAPYARKDGDWTQIAGSTPEVFTYDTIDDFPVTGSNNTLYVDKSTSKIYFYDTDYVETKITHNLSSGLQGGTTNEYYHLTSQQKSLVLGINGSISSSTLSPITVTDNGDGTVTTGSVLMLLKASTALDAEAHSAVLAGIGPIALTINNKYFLVGDWNGGNPIQRIEAVSATTINDYSIALIGLLTRGIGGDIYYTDIGQLQLDANNKVLRRLDDSQGLIIKTSGGIVSSSAGRYLQITAARYFIASNVKYVSALDTTGADRFSQMYGDSTAGFTETTGLQQINNTQYWNTTTHTLDNLSVGRFSVRWIFQLIDGPDEVYSFIGTNQYTTLASARSALLTNDLPAQLQQYLAVSVLIAKIIVQQGNANVIEVNNIVNTTSQQIATSDHNQLSTLQGGTTDEYYHLTAQRHETLTELADGRFSPVSDSTTAFQITKADETTSVFSVDTTNSRVGIGTTAPSDLLHIAKDSRLSAYFVSHENSIDPTNLILRKTRGTQSAPLVVQDGDSLGAINFQGYSAIAGFNRTACSIVGAVDGEPDSGGDSSDMPGRLMFYTVPDGGSGLVERMRITSDGNVGIGTTSPTHKLDIAGGDVNIADTYGYRSGGEYLIGRTASTNIIRIGSGVVADSVAIYGGGDERMRITSAGNVGIGTTTPTCKLNAYSTSALVSEFATNSTDATVVFIKNIDTGSKNWGIGVSGSNNLGGAGAVGNFYIRNESDASVKFTITPTGNVAISNTLSYRNGTNYSFTFSGTPTADRTITMPNASGTVALLESSNIFSGSSTSINETINCVSPSLTFKLLAGTSSQGQRTAICGGSTLSGATGAYLTVNGNTFGSSVSGFVVIQCGDASGARIALIGPVLSSSAYALTTATAANVVVDSAGLLQRSTSARKYKANITNIANIDTSFVYQIEPVKYTSLGEFDDKNKWFLGIVADQVNELEDPMAKLLVNYGADGIEVEGFQYERLTVLLLKEIQNLNERLKVLEEA